MAADQEEDEEDLEDTNEEDLEMDVSDKNLLIQLLMNQQLSAGIPITNRLFDQYKCVHLSNSMSYEASCVELQGYRDNMEDQHLIHFNFCANANVSIFGVFDGHGGDLTSKFVTKTLIQTLKQNIVDCRFDDQSLIKSVKELDQKWIAFELKRKKIMSAKRKKQQKRQNKEAIRFTLDSDDEQHNETENENENESETETAETKDIDMSDIEIGISDIENEENMNENEDAHPMTQATTNEYGSVGSTLVFCIVEYDTKHNHYKVTTINLGDSRAILLKHIPASVPQTGDNDSDTNMGTDERKPQNEYKLIELTNDHKPDIDQERERIINAGGHVKFNRVDGDLALSRAIGDTRYKQNEALSAEEQKISCVPSMTRQIANCNDYLVLFCDGIVEYKDNEDVFDFLCDKLNDGETVIEEKELRDLSICSQLRETELNYLRECESLQLIPKHSIELRGLQKILLDLTDWALESGSKDNMSAMLIKFGKRLSQTLTAETAESAETYESSDLSVQYSRIWSPCEFYQHKIQFNNIGEEIKDKDKITLDRFMRLFEADCSAAGWDMSVKYENALLQKILYINDLITNYKRKYDIKALISTQNNKLMRLEQEQKEIKEEDSDSENEQSGISMEKRGIKRRAMDKSDDFIGGNTGNDTDGNGNGEESPRKRRRLSE